MDPERKPKSSKDNSGDLEQETDPLFLRDAGAPRMSEWERETVRLSAAINHIDHWLEKNEHSQALSWQEICRLIFVERLGSNDKDYSSDPAGKNPEK